LDSPKNNQVKDDMALLTEGGGISIRGSINIPLLTEGGGISMRDSINIALLTEGESGYIS
jgi:hypothetical protein